MSLISASATSDRVSLNAVSVRNGVAPLLGPGTALFRRRRRSHSALQFKGTSNGASQIPLPSPHIEAGLILFLSLAFVVAAAVILSLIDRAATRDRARLDDNESLLPPVEVFDPMETCKKDQ